MTHVLVYITAADGREAEKLASLLVEERLAACVNVVPAINSYYRWEGKLQVDQEALLFVKTRAPLVDRLVERVKEIHSYSVPAVLTLGIKGGNAGFLQWVSEETREND